MNEMIKINKIIFYVIIILLSNITMLHAQNVKGHVMNSRGENIEYATVVLHDKQGHILYGCISDSIGMFNLPYKEQASFLECSYIGYKKMRINLATQESNNIKIVLEDSVNLVKDIVIKGKKPLIRRDIDKIILDANRLTCIFHTHPKMLLNEEFSCPNRLQ